MQKHYVSALILAAGYGSRMKSDKTKQLMTIGGKCVVARSVELYTNAPSVDEIVVVTRAEELEFVKNIVKDIPKVKKVIVGGKNRAESAKNGFYAISPDAEFVAVHDAARCLTPICDIENVIRDAIKFGAASASTPVTDTVKNIDNDGFISSTPDRRMMRCVQTPQVFSAELYKKALEAIDISDERITDDNYLIENIGGRVCLTETSEYNIKITTQKDIAYAEFLLKGGAFCE